MQLQTRYTSQEQAIIADWIKTLKTEMLDKVYGELKGNELTLYKNKDSAFLSKLNADILEFAQTMPAYKQAQAKALLADDPEYFQYLLDYTPEQYVSQFATYGGTECRLIYRTWFGLKGYTSFAYVNNIDPTKPYNGDNSAIMWIKQLFESIEQPV